MLFDHIIPLTSLNLSSVSLDRAANYSNTESSTDSVLGALSASVLSADELLRSHVLVDGNIPQV